jgi:hypothetical protein
MATTHHTPLFHTRLVRERLPSEVTAAEDQARTIIEGWLEALARGDLDETKETSLHGEFLVKVFGEVLGYRTMTRAHQGQWELVAEKSVTSGQADGALGFFRKGSAHVVAPIELKGAKQFLDHAKGRALTPVQQGWDYANKLPESRWIIVSNYRETRLYAKSKGQGAYELFRLEDLAVLNELRRFRALLGRDALLPSAPGAASVLDELLLASDRKDREITEGLYARYREIRVRLFDELRRTHRKRRPAELLRHAQTILDRVLFVAFAEDRGLLPPDTLASAYKHRDPYHPRPLWENFTAVFRWVDVGNPAMNFSAYNGGLFRPDPDLDALALSDDACGWFKELATYDFRDDVSVEVLGHIFEQSIADLEELRAEAEATHAVEEAKEPVGAERKAPSKRKTEGVFYTPPFVTNFIVRETLGKVFQERWDASIQGRNISKKDQLATWEAYREALRTVRVLDPACGSGAFLVAAFDALAQEYERANRAIAELKGGQTGLFDPTRVVLNENLFGVDLNGESVEITRLSLWLKTATRGKPLTHLDRNIRWGNSVVSDAALDPRAYDWKKGRPVRALLDGATALDEDEAKAIESRWREGFDVVLGNPPYVRQELLTRYKDHWRKEFRAFDGTADLFVYFFERAIQQLKPGGRMAFIVSNKWLRGGYAEALREMLAGELTIESLVDFGHAPIFPDADAFPCIVALRKAPAPEGHAVTVTQFPRAELQKVGIAEYVETHREEVPQKRFGRAGWSLESGRVDALMEKIRRVGTPLAEYAGVKPYCGLKTGCNEAFLIDDATKAKLCKDDPNSKSLLRKYLRGQDVARWSPEWAGLWMIVMKSSGDHDWPWKGTSESDAEEVFRENYPAIHTHMKPFEATLRKRVDRGQYWWELRSCAYYDLFEKDRLIYQEIQFHPAYAWDRDGFLSNNKVFFVPTQDAWLLAALNSPLMWWFNWRYLVHLKDEALTPVREKVVALPIAVPNDAQHKLADTLVPAVVALTRTNHEHVAGVLDSLQVQFDVEPPGQRLADFPALDEKAFVAEVVKRRGRKPLMSPAALKQLRALFQSEAPPVMERRATIRGHEEKIAAAVEAAYGLTKTERALLWETAPPRMPFTPTDARVPPAG